MASKSCQVLMDSIHSLNSSSDRFSFFSRIFTRASRTGFRSLSLRMIGSLGFGLMSFLASFNSSFVTEENSFRKSICETMIAIGDLTYMK